MRTAPRAAGARMRPAPIVGAAIALLVACAASDPSGGGILDARGAASDAQVAAISCRAAVQLAGRSDAADTDEHAHALPDELLWPLPQRLRYTFPAPGAPRYFLDPRAFRFEMRGVAARSAELRDAAQRYCALAFAVDHNAVVRCSRTHARFRVLAR